MWASLASRASWSAVLVAVLMVTGCGSAAFDLDSSPGAAQNQLPTDDQLKAMLDDVLSFNQQRYMNTIDHGAWQIMHGVLAYGYDTYIYADGKLVAAMQFGLDGGHIDGFTFRPGTHGLDSILEAGSKRGQGHDDQWLAIMAQANVPIDATIVVNGTKYTVRDLVTEAQWGLYEGAEASWTLTSLNKYLIHSLEDYDKTWKARDGGEWSVARIVEMEAGYELNQSACGGTHRLMSMTGALNKYKSLGGKVEGGWLLAQQKIDGAIERFREFQNPDGSFSTAYMIRPGVTTDITRRINTTGHTVEFLVQALPQQRLREPWLVRGVVALCEMLKLSESLSVECGSLYHALHGLLIYREKLYGKWQPFTPPELNREVAPAPPVKDDAAGTPPAENAGQQPAPPADEPAAPPKAETPAPAPPAPKEKDDSPDSPPSPPAPAPPSNGPAPPPPPQE